MKLSDGIVPIIKFVILFIATFLLIYLIAVSRQNSSNNNDSLFTYVIIWVFFNAVLGIRSTQLQREYVQKLAEFDKSVYDYLVSNEISDKITSTRLGSLHKSTWKLWLITWTKQDNGSIEKFRQKVVYSYWQSVATFLLGAVVVVYLVT